MKILLVYPADIRHCSVEDSRYFPHGILYIAAALRKIGHKVSFVDLMYENDLSILDKMMEGVDAVGSCFNISFFEKCKVTLKYIKNINSKIPCIVGGPYPTSSPHEMLEMGFDFVVLGEGEETIVELLGTLEQKHFDNVSGIAYRNNGQVMINKMRAPIDDLDSITFPARNLVNLSRYNQLVLITSRGGCPYNCTYCSHIRKKMFGRKLRKRSPGNVAEEMEEIIKRYPGKTIEVLDDCFTIIGMEWLKDFANKMRQKKLYKRWNCRTRVDLIDEETAKLLKEAGCYEIAFGVESGSQKILDFYKKGVKVKQIIDAFKLCHNLGIKTYAYIMIGAPIETRNDLKMTFDLIRSIKPHNYELAVTAPFPGTDLYKYCLERKMLNPNIDTKYFSRLHYVKSYNIRELGLPIKLPFLTKPDLASFMKKVESYMARKALFKRINKRYINRLKKIIAKGVHRI